MAKKSQNSTAAKKPTPKSAKKSTPESSLLAKNKKAYHDYEVLDTYEAGIMLTGPEVKSCREHRANLKGSHVHIHNNAAFAEGIHISPYRFAPDKKYNPTQSRKLLLHQKQIDKLDVSLNEQGVAIVPLKLYLKGSLIKVEVGVCRGRKLHDKRDMLKKRSQDLETNRAIKNY
jgi:SsrA-binding protein